jgi:hypothetical protein
MSATLQRPPTRSGTRLLPEARELVLPDGIVASGWPAVHATCQQVGIGFDSWQQDLNKAILAKNAFGLYAADTVGMSIPRQVGKTYDVGALIFGDSIVNPGTTTIWTAHRFKVAREAFEALRAMAVLPAMAAHIDPDAITTGAGNEVIPFRNGSRIVFAARERGAIRGFTKVRRLVLDEAQILTTMAMSDLAPTMNQATNPQVIAMGTPPKPTDPSEWFTELRTGALAGTSEGTLWIEFGAEPGSKPDDRAAWRKANPSYPTRTPEAAILRLRKLLTLEDFLREALGIWDSTSLKALLSYSVWETLGIGEPDEDEDDRGAPSYGVKFSNDGATVALAGCTKGADGSAHVELLDHRSMAEGKEWLVDRLVEDWRRIGEIVIDGKSDTGDLKQALRDAGVAEKAIHVVKVDEVITAHSMFHEAFKRSTLTHFAHPGQESLDQAVKYAAKRLIGKSGGWGWQSISADVDVTPLDAATLALFGAMTTKRKPGRKAVLL